MHKFSYICFILTFSLVLMFSDAVSAEEVETIDPLQKFFVYSLSADNNTRISIVDNVKLLDDLKNIDDAIITDLNNCLPEMSYKETAIVAKILNARSAENRGYICDMVSLGATVSNYIDEMPATVSEFNTAIIGDAGDNRGFNYFTTIISFYNLYTLFGGDPHIAKNNENMPGIIDMYVASNVPSDVIKKVSGALNNMPTLKEKLEAYEGNSSLEKMISYAETIVNRQSTWEISRFKRTLLDIGSFYGSYIPETGNEKFGGLAFRDIDDFSWAHSRIKALSDKGIIKGTGTYSFSPHDNITREQFVKLITLAFNIDTSESDEISFTDVENGQWYYPYICAAYKNNLITGEGDGIFGVGNPITREQMATIIYRACQNLSYKTDSGKSPVKFTDADKISNYAADAVNAMSANGIINGMDDGRFAPRENANRAQAAVMIYNTMNFYGLVSEN